MIDPTEPLRAALDDFGVDAVINYGPATLRVIADLADSTVIRGGSGGEMERQGPTALALLADVVAADLVSGNNGDLLTIDGVEYALLAVDPDGQGGAALFLEAAP